MVADRAPCRCSQQAMVTSIMAGDTANHRSFDAPLRIGGDRRDSKSQRQRHTTENSFHCGQLRFSCLNQRALGFVPDLLHL